MWKKSLVSLIWMFAVVLTLPSCGKTRSFIGLNDNGNAPVVTPVTIPGVAASMKIVADNNIIDCTATGECNDRDITNLQVVFYDINGEEVTIPEATVDHLVSWNSDNIAATVVAAPDPLSGENAIVTGVFGGIANITATLSFPPSSSYGYSGKLTTSIAITILSTMPDGLPKPPVPSPVASCSIDEYTPSCDNVDGIKLQIEQYQVMGEQLTKAYRQTLDSYNNYMKLLDGYMGQGYDDVLLQQLEDAEQTDMDAYKQWYQCKQGAIKEAVAELQAFTVSCQPAPSDVATVSSDVWTVSVVVDGVGTISDVPYGTSKEAFEANLTPDDPNESWDDFDSGEIDDPVVTGDNLVVTAQDGTTVINYNVVVLAPSHVATVSSDVYSAHIKYMDDGSGRYEAIIQEVPFNTSAATFEANLIKDDPNETWSDTGLSDPVMSDDTFVVTAQDGVTQIIYTVLVNPLAIGDIYNGNLVAYILQPEDPGYTENQPRGLMVALSDQSTGMQWYNGDYVETDATDTTIGGGLGDTQTIVSVQGEGSYAAQLCNDMNQVEEGSCAFGLPCPRDWFLPSKDELNKIYVNLAANSIGGFGNYNYWSSSESVRGNAWCQSFFSGGSQVNTSTNGRLAVRCARAFYIVVGEREK